MLPYFAGLGSLFGRAESGTLGSESARKPVMRFLILAAFFLSGVSSLIYQVVWSRTLTLVFGATVFAVTTVLTAFMAGMALGSFYLGRFVDRRGNPLKIYAYLQAGIGVFAIILPFILDGVGFIYITVNRNLQISFYLLSFIKFLLCFIVLIIPATLIGV